jgi:hypothetical protein
MWRAPVVISWLNRRSQLWLEKRFVRLRTAMKFQNDALPGTALVKFELVNPQPSLPQKFPIPKSKTCQPA